MNRSHIALASKAALALALLVQAPVPAAAQASFDAPEEEHWKLGFDGRAYDEADVDSGGSLGLTRLGAWLGREWAVSSASTFDAAFRHEISRYDFDGGATFVVPDFLDEAKEDTLSLGFAKSGDRQFFIAGSFVSGREDGVSFSESFYVEGITGMLFRVSEDFDLGLGVAARSHLEDAGDVFPLPLFEWRATERLRFLTLRSADFGVAAIYSASEQLDLFCGARIDHRQLQLQDENLLQDSVFVDEETALRAGVTWRARSVELRLFGGHGERDISLESGGDEIADDEVDGAAMIGAAVSFEL